MADTPDADPDADLDADGSDDPDGLGGEVPAPNGTGADEADDEESIGLIEARSLAVEAVEQLLEHEFEGVVGVDRTDDGWRALVEVVERSAVPDTQDIIGRYEIELAPDGSLAGYGLSERYRRGDMREEL